MNLYFFATKMQYLLILYKYCTNVVCTFGVLATIEILPEEPGATPVESGEGSSGAWRTLQWILKKAPVKSGERSSAQCVHLKVGWNRIQKRTVKYTNLCKRYRGIFSLKLKI